MSLRQCKNCLLLFRTPTDVKDYNKKFYQNDYYEGVTTEIPSYGDLDNMMKNNFSNIGKNFTKWIEIFKLINPSVKILDFGCSWGYSSYQIKKAGFDVTGYEISSPRGKFAQKNLDVDVIFNEKDLPDKAFDLVFSSHVIEHVPNPAFMIDLIKRVLKPGGIFLGVTPNGSEECMKNNYHYWMSAWGRKHPFFITDTWVKKTLTGLPWFIFGENENLTGNIQMFLQDKKQMCRDLKTGHLVFGFTTPNT